MKTKVLIADDDMDAQQLLFDVVEINFRSVVIERALSGEAFWAKVEGGGEWNILFVSADYITECENFTERLRNASATLFENIVVTGEKNDLDALTGEIKERPQLAKPFSLDAFEEIISGMADR